VTIVERLAGEIQILELRGKLTLGEGTEDLHAAVDGLLARGQNQLILHMAEVPSVDSAGLGEIVRSINLAKRAGGDAKLSCPSQRLLDLLHTGRVHAFVDAYASEQEAIASFARTPGR
jgi:anti-anti-sigma factor